MKNLLSLAKQKDKMIKNNLPLIKYSQSRCGNPNRRQYVTAETITHQFGSSLSPKSVFESGSKSARIDLSSRIDFKTYIEEANSISY